MIRIDHERAFANLRKLGIPLGNEELHRDIDYCNIDIARGCPAYYRRRALAQNEGGIKAQNTPRHLNLISSSMLREDATDPTLIRNCLIGFLYMDGTIRQDVIQVLDDVYGNAITGKPALPQSEWPNFVLFWKDHVPVAHRGGLAAYLGPHDNKIRVMT